MHFAPSLQFSTRTHTHTLSLFLLANKKQIIAQTPMIIDFLRSLVNRTTVVKLLLILAYSQMLIQQMDNQTHLIQDLQSTSSQPALASGCCSASSQADHIAHGAAAADSLPLADWFNCMWTSSKACSGGGGATNPPASDGKSPLARLLASVGELCVQIFDSLVLLASASLEKLASVHLLLRSVVAIWLARWRSPIVQRLLQSILVQVSYVGSLLVAPNEQRDDFL